MDIVIAGVAWYAVFVFSTTFHEAAHALAAMRMGDTTAYRGGQVSLDPIPHIRRERIGMVVVPIISFFFYNGQWMLGWASAPCDPMWAARYPRRAAGMAMAGPFANLTLALAAALFIRIGMLFQIFYAPESITFTQVTTAMSDNGVTNALAFLLSICFSLNLIFFVFNLLPVPPLDGSWLPLLFLGHEASMRYMRFIASPMFMIIGLCLAWNYFWVIFSPVHTLALNLLYPGMGYHVTF